MATLQQVENECKKVARVGEAGWSKIFVLETVPTEDQISDLLRKLVSATKHEFAIRTRLDPNDRRKIEIRVFGERKG